MTEEGAAGEGVSDTQFAELRWDRHRLKCFDPINRRAAGCMRSPGNRDRLLCLRPMIVMLITSAAGSHHEPIGLGELRRVESSPIHADSAEAGEGLSTVCRIMSIQFVTFTSPSYYGHQAAKPCWSTMEF